MGAARQPSPPAATHGIAPATRRWQPSFFGLTALPPLSACSAARAGPTVFPCPLGPCAFAMPRGAQAPSFRTLAGKGSTGVRQWMDAPGGPIAGTVRGDAGKRGRRWPTTTRTVKQKPVRETHFRCDRGRQYTLLARGDGLCLDRCLYIFFVFFLPSGFTSLAEGLKDIFEQPEAWRLENANDVVGLIGHIFRQSAPLVVPVFILLIVFGIGSSVAQNMPALVLNRIAPKMERISPMSGLKRIYGLPGLVEFGKSLFKIVIVSMIVVLVLENDFYESLDAMFADPMTLFARITKDLNQIIMSSCFRPASSPSSISSGRATTGTNSCA